MICEYAMEVMSDDCALKNHYCIFFERPVSLVGCAKSCKECFEWYRAIKSEKSCSVYYDDNGNLHIIGGESGKHLIVEKW